MKVTFDIPDDTVCAFLNFVYGDADDLQMALVSASTDDLLDGAAVVFDPEGGEG